MKVGLPILLLWLSSLHFALPITTTPNLTSNVPPSSISPTGPQPFTIGNHPALGQLFKNAPLDNRNRIPVIPPIHFCSLNNPLDNRYAVLSADGQRFTMIPRCALLYESSNRLADKLVQTKMPTVSFLAPQAFLAKESQLYGSFALRGDNTGHYYLDQNDRTRVLKESSTPFVVLVDQRCGFPISNLTEKQGKPEHPVAIRAEGVRP